jgi:hypothetical protein
LDQSFGLSPTFNHTRWESGADAQALQGALRSTEAPKNPPGLAVRAR